MAASQGYGAPASEEEQLGVISEFLGGKKIFKKGHSPRTYLEAHEALVQGLPGISLGHLIGRLEHLDLNTVQGAIGMSVRTYHRLKSTRRLLSQEQSSRVWKLAEILAKATTVFGSQQKAEQWLGQPAKGLNDRRPVELLATQTGAELVEQFLERLDHGVYV